MNHKMTSLNMRFLGTSQAPWKEQRDMSSQPLPQPWEEIPSTNHHLLFSFEKNGLSHGSTLGQSALEEKHGI